MNIYLQILIVVLVILPVYMYIEAGLVKIEKTEIGSNPRLRIMHLSDIHLNFLRVSVKRVNMAIKEETPDVIIFTGDFIEKLEHIPKLKEWLKAIDINCPAFACLGNHEYSAFKSCPGHEGEFISALGSLNIQVLNNESYLFINNGIKYNLIGIADLRTGRPNINKAFGGLYPNAERNIAFSHNPDLVLKLPRDKVDLFLCGHFHGGQIWMPFQMEYFLMRGEKLCRMGISRGLHEVNGIPTYINRGLGNVMFPLRFLSRPEIAIIEV